MCQSFVSNTASLSPLLLLTQRFFLTHQSSIIYHGIACIRYQICFGRLKDFANQFDASAGRVKHPRSCLTSYTPCTGSDKINVTREKLLFRDIDIELKRNFLQQVYFIVKKYNYVSIRIYFDMFY